jgi:hypothetical protein
VELVDNHVAQVLEEHRPLGVMGQDAGVQHVRVGQDEVRPGPDRPPRVLGRVAVVGEHAQLGEAAGQLLQLGQLVLGQRLGGEEVEHPGLGLGQQRLEHRQVVAERLARGGRRHHHEVLSLFNQFPSASLMRVELADASPA